MNIPTETASASTIWIDTLESVRFDAVSLTTTAALAAGP